MREVSFVDKLTFDFNGNIAKNALAIGDADNDKRNELVCANLQGDLAIFKGREQNCWARASNLGMVTACVIGDITNVGKNHVTAINTEGWLYIFDTDNLQLESPSGSTTVSTSNAALTETSLGDQESTLIAIGEQKSNESDPLTSNAHKVSTSSEKSAVSVNQAAIGSKKHADSSEEGGAASKQSLGWQDNTKTTQTTRQLIPCYKQRMPANARVMLLADLDGDKLVELIIGLTDRVLRTYRWIKIGDNKGKFVGIYKWEFADQIGAVSLNPSRHQGCQDIIVAQPGGTYAKLECIEKKSSDSSVVHSSSQSKLAGHHHSNNTNNNTVNQTGNYRAGDSNRTFNDDDNVHTEYISKLTPEYHQLALAQMRNPHISTEILGGIKGSAIAGGSSMKKSKFAAMINKSKSTSTSIEDSNTINKSDKEASEMTMEGDEVEKSPGKGKSGDDGLSASSSLIVISTIDGTLMLVNKDEVLWSIQVDHQLFALDKLEIPFEAAANDSTTSRLSDELGDERLQDLSNVTPSGRQYLIACAWDGKTYIVDEDRNYLRFKFSEAVSSFAAGNYYFDDKHQPSLIYATFNNQIILYYNVELDNIKPRYLLDEILNNPTHCEILAGLEKLANIRRHGRGSPERVDKPKLESLSSDTDQESGAPVANIGLIKQILHEILYEQVPPL